MLILGVDPGVTGALALVDLARSRLVSALDMPIMRFETKTRLAVDTVMLDQWLGELPSHPDAVVIEHQQPFEGSSKHDAFVLGVTFGAVITAMVGLSLPIHFAVPTVWKRKAGLVGRPKEDALVLARQTFGLCEALTIARGVTNKVQAIARADAALIAWHGLPKQMHEKAA